MTQPIISKNMESRRLEMNSIDVYLIAAITLAETAGLKVEALSGKDVAEARGLDTRDPENKDTIEKLDNRFLAFLTPNELIEHKQNQNRAINGLAFAKRTTMFDLECSGNSHLLALGQLLIGINHAYGADKVCLEGDTYAPHQMSEYQLLHFLQQNGVFVRTATGKTTFSDRAQAVAKRFEEFDRTADASALNTPPAGVLIDGSKIKPRIPTKHN